MCLILFAWQTLPGAPLLVAANRDELFDRPASPAAFWQDTPGVIAGRDLSAGGTWLGFTRAGRFAALTNYRNPADRRSDAPSRGALVRDFLAGERPAREHAGALCGEIGRYNGFSLLLCDGQEMWFVSNRGGDPAPVAPGYHGLSNHLLDTPWPKVSRGREQLRGISEQRAVFDAEDYFDLLDSTEPAPDSALPDTGVGLERERRLSSLRIPGPGYGTRCSTVLRVGSDSAAEFHERTWSRGGDPAGTVSHRFNLTRRPG